MHALHDKSHLDLYKNLSPSIENISFAFFYISGADYSCWIGDSFNFGVSSSYEVASYNSVFLFNLLLKMLKTSFSFEFGCSDYASAGLFC